MPLPAGLFGDVGAARRPPGARLQVRTAPPLALNMQQRLLHISG